MTELADGSLELDLKVSPSPELEGSILRWAGDVAVVTPGKLRGRMRILGDELSRVHRGGEQVNGRDSRARRAPDTGKMRLGSGNGSF